MARKWNKLITKEVLLVLKKVKSLTLPLSPAPICFTRFKGIGQSVKTEIDNLESKHTSLLYKLTILGVSYCGMKLTKI